jgi:superfamily II RNA helicase
VPSPDQALDVFLERIRESKLELYPAQEEAILELYSGKNVILNTPTGSGKSLVAAALHFESLARGRRSFYTSPIKALVNEKFLALCRDFGPERVGMATGDGAVNPDAPIICCTAEILANRALREGASARVDDVVMDEFHYYSDRERGGAWQIPLLTLPQARFLLMSATLGDTDFFEKELTRLTGKETALVQSTSRPVPLDFKYEEIPLHETISRLVTSGRAPIYLVNFTQREAAEEAQNLLSVDFSTKDEKRAIQAELEGVRFASPYGKELQKLLRHGVGLHHAGLLPRYRLLVEKLAQKGLLKIISGTDTLGVGVNVPIRTVLFTKLCKYDGEKTTILSVRDFQQIAGRAGRKGFDDLGTVVAQAPEHVVENLRLESKAKKFVKKKPPEKGYVPWNKETFDKLVNGKPEPLVSRFFVTHGLLLNVLSRPGEEGCHAMRQLIRDCHESDRSKKNLRRTAFQQFRSLAQRGIIQLNPLKLNVELQEDFSLHHALSLYLIDTLVALDPTEPNYALDLLTLVESILENPALILAKQLDKIKREAMARMKAEGVEFDERIAELDKLEYPKPNRDFIYSSFNEFAARHPWVGQDNIRPKSIAREMVEQFLSFSEYIREYELQRSEGLLLRYITEVYKTLAQTVPEAAKTDDVRAIEVYFSSLLRQIDSSLIDEWEKLKNPAAVSFRLPEAEPLHEVQDITRDRKIFTVLIRNEVFRFVKALSIGDFEEALTYLAAGPRAWTVADLEARARDYAVDHVRLCTDAKARSPVHLKIDEGAPEVWKVEQILVDADEHNDWSARFELDLLRSREEGRPILMLLSLGEIE